ncbi:MAG: alpha-L-rhamnosidase C-terminal domain-containing protein [Bacteroidota bacterium]|nr:alpha-L-rhamnosidase C-terminal domain-containing protein [Bacteroidota bacterium]
MKTLKSLISLISFFFSTNICFSQFGGIAISPGELQSSFVSPQQIIKVGENHYFIDFGKDAFGTLEVLTQMKLSDSVIIHLGEKLAAPNKIDRNPGGTIRYQKIILTDIPVNSKFTLNLKADKRNTNPPAVALPDTVGVIMPFRYCEIENFNAPITNLILRQKVFNYRFSENNSYFTCSDTTLNQVWNLCKHTIKATSFCGLYIDGDRERTPYEADAFINQLSHYCVDNEYLIARRTNEYFITNPTWPTEWILHTVLLFYYDYLYTGNKEPLIKYYDVLKAKTLIDLEREDGLISSKSKNLTPELMSKLGFKDNKQSLRDIVDWPPAQSATSWKLATNEGERDGYEMVEINTVVNSFHYVNLQLMAEIAGSLNKKEDSIYFHNKSVLVKKSINQKLLDKTSGIYVDGENSKHSSLHANMLPLAFDIVPKKYADSVVSFIKKRGMACSVYGTQYLLEGLYKHHSADYALSLMTSTSDRSWWNMVRIGSTMALESWDMKYKPNSDWNHAWGTAPANIITRYMWGITPAKPGFEKVHIKPQLADLTFSKIKVPTIKGAILAEFKETSKKGQLFIIELPQDMQGDFVLPQHTGLKVLINKKKVIPSNGKVPLNSGLTRIEIN